MVYFGRLIALLLIIIFGDGAHYFFGFESTVIGFLGLIYWALPQFKD